MILVFVLHFPRVLGQCHFCIPDSPVFLRVSGFQGENGVQNGSRSPKRRKISISALLMVPKSLVKLEGTMARNVL